MPDLTTLIVRIIADATKYQDTLAKTEKDTLSFSQRATNGLASFGGSIVTGAAWAAGVAFTGLGFIVNGAAREAMNAEEVASQLNSTLANTGPITGVTADMVSKLADHYQGLTRFEDDMIISGGEVLGRFKEINSTVFPDALRLSLDLATKWGTSVPDAAGILGKALADPGAGLMKLKLAGVVFNAEQEKMIQTMTEAGDVAGAQALIMDVVNKAVGGSAEAAGKTAAGTWERLKNIWGNTLETLGTGLVPALTKLGDTLTVYLNKPEVAVFVDQLATGIGNFAMSVVTNLPIAIQWIQNAFGWLEEHKGVIVAALAVIGVAVGAWVYTVVTAAVAMLAAMWPVILIMAVVAAAAYLIYTAWTENWGGIQQKVQTVIDFVKNLISAGLQFIQDLNSGKLGWISDVWKSTWDLIKLYFTTFWENIKSILALFQAAFSGDWKRFGEILREIWDRSWKLLGEILKTAWDNIVTILKNVIPNIINFFKNIDWGQIGRNIVKGIAEGLFGNNNVIDRAIQNLADHMLDVLQGFLGIHSPSTVFEMEVGWQMAAGTVQGWTRGIRNMFSSTLDSLLPTSQLQFSPAMATNYGGVGGYGIAPARESKTIVVPVTYVDQSLINTNSEYEAKQKLRDIVNDINRENENK